MPCSSKSVLHVCWNCVVNVSGLYDSMVNGCVIWSVGTSALYISTLTINLLFRKCPHLQILSSWVHLILSSNVTSFLSKTMKRGRHDLHLGLPISTYSSWLWLGILKTPSLMAVFTLQNNDFVKVIILPSHHFPDVPGYEYYVKEDRKYSSGDNRSYHGQSHCKCTSWNKMFIPYIYMHSSIIN